MITNTGIATAATQRAISAGSGVVPPTSRRTHSSTRPAPPLADARAVSQESMQDSNSTASVADPVELGEAGGAAAHREQLQHRIELADRRRQVGLRDGELEPVALGARIRRQLDAYLEPPCCAARRDPDVEVR